MSKFHALKVYVICLGGRDDERLEDKDTKRESADSDGSESESDDDADVSKVLLPS